VLQHRAAVLPPDAPVRVTAEMELRASLMLGTAASSSAEPIVVNYRLADWGHDDLIEYLLTVHRDHCSSVMARVRKSDQELLRGVPEHWQVVLDQLANDPSIPDVRAALGHYLQRQLSDTDLVERARSVCLVALTKPVTDPSSSDELFGAASFPRDVVRILRHAPVQPGSL
jgi:hypothetical protein